MPFAQLLHFVGYLLILKRSYKTVAMYLNAISYIHNMNGNQDTTIFSVVTKSLNGLRRLAGITKDTRIFISLELFSKIIHSFPYICNSLNESAHFFSISHVDILVKSQRNTDHSMYEWISRSKLTYSTKSPSKIARQTKCFFFLRCGHNSTPNIYQSK